MYICRIFNQHAQCGHKANGRYPLAAYRNALKKAGKHFLAYRTTHCVLNERDEFNHLFEGVKKSWKAQPYGRCAHAKAGLVVEIEKV